MAGYLKKGSSAMSSRKAAASRGQLDIRYMDQSSQMKSTAGDVVAEKQLCQPETRTRAVEEMKKLQALTKSCP
eukprot:scaffold55789_cov58-Cyclotella_meneghiniana.AAC.3